MKNRDHFGISMTQQAISKALRYPIRLALIIMLLVLAGCTAEGLPSPEATIEPTPEPTPEVTLDTSNYLPVQLTYLGNSCIVITSPDGTIIVSDPFAANSKPNGLAELPADLTANAVTVSHTHADHNNPGAVGGDPQILTEPGTYQIGEVKVTGYLGWEGSPSGPNESMRNVIFVFETNGVKIVQLGDSGIVTDPEVLSAIENADIILVNIDGYVIADLEIIPFMQQIKARTVILEHYTLEGKRVWNGAPTAEEFVSEFASDAIILRTGKEMEVTMGMPQQIAILRPPVELKK